MSCPLCPKLGLATAVLLVVVHTAADGHTHEDAVPEEPCRVCVAAADLAPVVAAPKLASRLLLAGWMSDDATAAPLPAYHEAYLARAPPFS